MWPRPTESKTREVPLTEVAKDGSVLVCGLVCEKSNLNFFGLAIAHGISCYAQNILKHSISKIWTFFGVAAGCNAPPVLSSPHYLGLRIASCLTSQVHLKLIFAFWNDYKHFWSLLRTVSYYHRMRYLLFLSDNKVCGAPRINNGRWHCNIIINLAHILPFQTNEEYKGLGRVRSNIWNFVKSTCTLVLHLTAQCAHIPWTSI